MARIDYREANRRLITEFFEAGCKQTRRLGFELEHSLIRKDTGKAASYSEPGGVRDVLERLAPAYDEQSFEDGNIVGLAKNDEVITLEPAAQLEISAGPFSDITEIERCYLDFRLRLNPILEEFGLDTPMTGYNLTQRAEDLELIPKFRYNRMNEFLGGQSPYGRCMMRGSASLQVSIDYASEEDAMSKIRVVSAMAPILSLITDNAPMFEGKPRKNHLVRAYVWAQMNQDRVGTVPGIMRHDFSFDDYADYIMTRQAILIPGGDEGWISAGDATFDDVYSDRRMTTVELEHALSMVWPDVRLKRFVEIRPADAMPFDFSIAYTALIKNLFYDRKNLRVLDDLIEGIGHSDVDTAKKSLFADGYEGNVYGKPARFWADELLLLAAGSATRDEIAYLEPLQSMVSNRFTLASTWQGSELGEEVSRKEEVHAVALETGAPRVGILPRFDFDLGDLSITEGYMTGVLAAGGFPFVLPKTDNPFILKRAIESCDGFIVPGGHDILPDLYGKTRELHLSRTVRERDQLEVSLVPSIIASGKPILGICRGMQMINVACGGTLHQDIHTSNPSSTIDHVQEKPYERPTHTVSVVAGSKLRDIVKTETLEVNSIHHQCVDRLGDGLRVAAYAPDGTIEAIESSGDAFVLGLQWHPEYLWREKAEASSIFKQFVRASAEQQRKSAAESASLDSAAL